jgi:hypothetical protein
MVADAEKYAEEDKATAERITSRNGLENYAFNLKNQVSNAEGLGGKLDDNEKETVSVFGRLPRISADTATAPRSRRRDDGMVSRDLRDRFD